MAAEQRIDIILDFDAETRKLQDAKAGLSQVTQQAGQIPPKLDQATRSGGRMGDTLKKVGGVLGAIGIGAFLLDTVRRAAQASDAMNELNTAWGEAIGLLSNELEPVIALVGQGLAGLMRVMIGTVRLIKESFTGAWTALAKAMSGDFVGAIQEARKGLVTGLGEFTDELVIAGERAAGISRAAEAVQSKIILEQTKARLKNERLSGEEKLKIIDENEKKAFDILRASGEFLQASKRQQAVRELEIEKEFASERLSARNQADAAVVAALQGQLDAFRSQAEQVGIAFDRRVKLEEDALKLEIEIIEEQGKIAVEAHEDTQRKIETARRRSIGRRQAIEREERQRGFDQEQRDQQEHFDILNSQQRMTRAESFAIIESWENLELDLIQRMEDTKTITIIEAEDRREGVRRQARGLRRQADQQELNERTAFFNALISAGSQAAAAEIEQSGSLTRALQAAAADQVQALANAAATWIELEGAMAAASTFRETSGGIIAKIAATAAVLAFYVGLGTVVRAAGGAAAAALRPPAPPPARDPGEKKEPLISAPDLAAEASAERARERAERPTRPPSAARERRVGMAPGQDQGRTIINIQSLDGRINQETMDTLLAALSRQNRGGG